MVWTAGWLLGIRYRVIGAENIPSEPCVILGKHESAWETLAFQVIFPPQVWVVKRELLHIPFFGWGLAMLSPIAIDRKQRRRALAHMVEQGRERLDSGFSIVIFPEGTRTAPGTRGIYQAGGAWLAIRTGAAVLPVAHNAGSYWPRNAFVKRPGVITVSIGPSMRAEGRKASAVMKNVEEWIENEMQRIRHEAR
jgi:1-acyl-sn-glycerol-3-phosphate acyltransferase